MIIMILKQNENVEKVNRYKEKKSKYKFHKLVP